MSFLKYFRCNTYEYDEQSSRQYVKSDTKIIMILCVIINIAMTCMLIAIGINPEFRNASGFDSTLLCSTSSILSALGVFLCLLPIKDNSAYMRERRFMRVYFSLLCLYISGFDFIFSDIKINSMFMYITYCIIVITLLHINPIVYAIQTSIVILLSVNIILNHFESISVAISFICLLLLTVFILAYDNLFIHIRLSYNIKLQKDREALEEELMRNQRELFEKANDQIFMQENVIAAIAELVENRDADTGTHIKSTAYYAKLIADGAIVENLYPDIIDEDFAYLIEKAAPMHDLGKISIPDAILKAPRRLTDAEFQIMKQHTLEGARIIDRIYIGLETPEYIQCASNIAKYHHERWDGNGYPCGLMMTDIPVEARIMAIADVFDALVNRRCYKDAYPMSDAFDMIAQGSGSQFDPDFVRIFLQYKDVIEKAVVEGFEDV